MARKKIKIFTEAIHFILSKELKNSLEKFCDDKEIGVSTVIRKAIRQYIDKQ